jgi:putative thioredoxin
MLTPILERLAAEGEGEWLLAKVNSDDNQQLSRDYGVRGIPNVKLFKDGKVVDEFVGARPKGFVKEFLAKWVTSKLDIEIAEIEAQIGEGELKKSRATLEQLMSQHPDYERGHIALARLALAERHPEVAIKHLELISTIGPNHIIAEQLRAHARFRRGTDTYPAKSDKSIEKLEATVKEEPSHLAARFELACAAALAQDYEKAAQQLFYILERNRSFQKRAAHQAMLDLFLLMGEDDPRTKEYRQRLSWLIFA